MKLSIIVPTYNREQVLKRCVESVLTQQESNVELIVVDDCSSDGSLAYLTSRAKSDARLNVFKLPVNRGVNAARNKGITKAKGEFTLFLDSDDYLVPDSIKNVLQLLDTGSYDHYLFLVSDRTDDKRLPTQDHTFTYCDWLRRNIQDDFTHVLPTKLLKQYQFFEEYRGFENLNWFRIFRTTVNQRFIRTCICIRDRNQTDSLTKSLAVQQKQRVADRHQATRQLISLYSDDYKKLAPKAFSSLLTKTILTGMRLNEYEANRTYITELSHLKPRLSTFLNVLNTCKSGNLINAAVSVRLLMKPVLKKPLLAP